MDPSFNIYEVALPWALQRALSPSTASGAETLRSSILTRNNKFQWARVEEMLQQQLGEQKKAAAAAGADGAQPEAASGRARLLSGLASAEATVDPALAAAGAAAQAAQAATPLDSLRTVLGSARGSQLRRIARDLDSTELMLKLLSPEARPARRLAVDKLSEALANTLASTTKAALRRLTGRAVPPAVSPAPAQLAWPTSDESLRLEARFASRARSTGGLLLRAHVGRQLAAGWRGAAAVGALSFVIARVAIAAVARALLRCTGRTLTKVLPAPVLAALAAGAAVISVAVGRGGGGGAGGRQESQGDGKPLGM